MRGNASALMSMPLSVTDTAIVDASGFQVRTSMRPSAGVNLTAFFIRFQTICCSRAPSPSTSDAPASKRVSSVSPFTRRSDTDMSSALDISVSSATVVKFRLSLPRAMLVRSSRSSISRASSSTLRRIRSSVGWAPSGIWCFISRRRTAARIGVSGVRNSCESTARKWSFARFAVSACSFATRKASAAMCSSVTSRMIFE